jgi:hypothetical protein
MDQGLSVALHERQRPKSVLGLAYDRGGPKEPGCRLRSFVIIGQWLAKNIGGQEFERRLFSLPTEHSASLQVSKVDWLKILDAHSSSHRGDVPTVVSTKRIESNGLACETWPLESQNNIED